MKKLYCFIITLFTASLLVSGCTYNITAPPSTDDTKAREDADKSHKDLNEEELKH